MILSFVLLSNSIHTNLICPPVPPKAKGKRDRREIIAPHSGLDVDALLSREKRQKISSDNAIPEFKQMLAHPPDDKTIVDACNQMSGIIRDLVKNSLGDSRYQQAMQNMREFRQQMISYEMPEIYNDFIRDLKSRVMKGQLEGDRREFWFHLRGMRLGLIDDNASEHSEVTEKEAQEVRISPGTLKVLNLKQYFSLKTDIPTRSKES